MCIIPNTRLSCFFKKFETLFIENNNKTGEEK